MVGSPRRLLFFSYTADLYWKFVYCCLGFVVVFGYWTQHFGDLFHIFCAPVCLPTTLVDFIFTEVSEAFYSGLILSLYSSVLCSLPLFMYLFILFLKPGLFIFESRYYKKKLFFFIMLVCLTQYTVLEICMPHLWSFWGSFSVKITPELLQPTLALSPRVYPYTQMVMLCLIVSFFLIQPPFFLGYWVQNSLQAGEFTIKRPVWYLCLLMAAALLSPPDLFLQLVCFLFLLFWFEIWVAYTLTVLLYKKLPFKCG